MPVAAKSKTKPKSAVKPKAKKPAGKTLTFGSPEWQAKYGKGKKK